MFRVPKKRNTKTKRNFGKWIEKRSNRPGKHVFHCILLNCSSLSHFTFISFWFSLIEIFRFRVPKKRNTNKYK